VEKNNVESWEDSDHLDLLKLLVSNLVLDLDRVLIVFILILGLGGLSLSLSLSLGLGNGGLGLLGRSRDFLVVGAVVTRRQDDRGRTLLGRSGSRSLGSGALDNSVILSIELFLKRSPGVTSGANGEAGELGEL
jgi:hypothetical protein